MRHPFLPSSLALALLLAGCSSAKPVAAGPTPVQARQAKVAAVTQALSLSKNAPLQQASQSLQQVSAELSKASFKQVGAALAGALGSAGGPLLAAGTLSSAMRRDAYALAAVSAGPDGQGTVTYDATTGELQAIENAGTKLTFAYAKPTATQRTATITIASSPDGTTGSLTLGATASTWAKQEAGQTPYTFMANEAPVDPQAMSLELALAPKGDPALAIKARLDADEQALTALGKAFTHLRLAGSLPRVGLDLEAHVKQADVALTGTIQVDTPDGREPFQLGLSYDAAHAQGKLDVTLVNAKVRIAADTAKKPDGAAALVYSTEDNSKIGQVDPPNPAEPGVLVIRFDDGTTTRWELVPKDFLPTPIAPAAAPPPTF